LGESPDRWNTTAGADVCKLYGRITGLKGAWKEAKPFPDENERLHRQQESRLGQAEVEEVRGRLHER